MEEFDLNFFICFYPFSIFFSIVLQATRLLMGQDKSLALTIAYCMGPSWPCAQNLGIFVSVSLKLENK